MAAAAAPQPAGARGGAREGGAREGTALPSEWLPGISGGLQRPALASPGSCPMAPVGLHRFQMPPSPRLPLLPTPLHEPPGAEASLVLERPAARPRPPEGQGGPSLGSPPLADAAALALAAPSGSPDGVWVPLGRTPRPWTPAWVTGRHRALYSPREDSGAPGKASLGTGPCTAAGVRSDPSLPSHQGGAPQW